MLTRAFWPLFSLAAAAVSVLMISTAASLALRRPDVQVFNVRLASAFKADYSIDPPTTIEPLDPAIIDAVIRDTQPSVAVRGVTPATPEAPVQPETPQV